MKKWIVLALILCLVGGLTGCAQPFQRYQTMFFGTFDTVVILIGYSQSETAFNKTAQAVEARFGELHRLFDRYNAYEGITNVYALNQQAGLAPVPVADELYRLLQLCKDTQPLLNSTVNVALGGVLSLWHDARAVAEDTPNLAVLPDRDMLEEAAKHANFDDVILDPVHRTVYFHDPLLTLDLGAVAKGFAAQQVADEILTEQLPSFILSAGGNVIAGAKPEDDRLRWGVAVQDPDGADADSIETLYLAGRTVVTSGDYQRYFTIDGTRYHHIIDPITLMPAHYVRAVTVVGLDSALCDLLSTALFLMPINEGHALVQTLPEVEALWVLESGDIAMTEGMKAFARSQGAMPR